MITYGYAKDHFYSGDGTLHIRVRIPSVHGPYKQSDYKGKVVRNYVKDENLPYLPSMLLPHIPTDGEVVVISSLNNSNNQFIVLGLTGGSYLSGVTNLGE